MQRRRPSIDDIPPPNLNWMLVEAKDVSFENPKGVSATAWRKYSRECVDWAIKLNVFMHAHAGLMDLCCADRGCRCAAAV